MNRLLSFSVLFTSFVGSFSAVAERQDFKCFVDSTVGEKIIFFSAEEKDKLKQQAALVASQLNRESHNRFYVKHVYECVTLDEAFKATKAKALDEQTVR